MKCHRCKGNGTIEDSGYIFNGGKETCPTCRGTGEVNSEDETVIQKKRRPCRLCQGLGTMQGSILTFEGRDEPCPLCHGVGLTD